MVRILVNDNRLKKRSNLEISKQLSIEKKKKEWLFALGIE